MTRDVRLAAAIGLTARMELRFERRAGRTQVTRAYAEPPFRLGRTFEFGDAASLIMVYAAPGVFAGDRLELSVHVGSGARVELRSQSALQIHPSLATEPASIDQRFVVEDDGELVCDWDPVIPFAGARLVQRFDLQLAANARLFWSDALMAGRVSRGECWQFDELDHRLRLKVAGDTGFLERYRVVPSDRPPTRTWAAADASYLGTTLIRRPDIGGLAADLQTLQTAPAPVRVAVDQLDPDLLVARLMSADGAGFRRTRRLIRDESVNI